MSGGLYLHGGALDLMKQQFPNAPKPWLDLSTGINPWAYQTPEIMEGASKHLPTAAQFNACRDAMAKVIGAPVTSLILAPGSELLIRLLPTILSIGSVAVASPSYADHFDVWQKQTKNIYPVADPLQHMETIDAIVVCNPNNPDGRRWSGDRLSGARTTLAARGGWLIVDEAYADLDPDNSVASLGGQDGLIVFRSFGKFFGLAGLRLGALIAPPNVLAAMQDRLGVWPVAGPTLQIAEMAYLDSDWQCHTRQRLQSMRLAMDDMLKKHDLRVTGGTDLFRFVRTTDAGRYWLALAKLGIYTRRFDWCDYSLRIGITPSQEALQRLNTALASVAVEAT